MKFKRISSVLLLGLMAILCLTASDESVFAQKGKADGALIINPKRVVFEGADRNETLTLINSGADSTTYQIVTAQMKMDDEGNLSEVDSISNQASSLIHYFPKQVTLGPNQSQTVRIQLLKPSNLATGEYRSYLKFIPVKKQAALTSRPDTGKNVHIAVSTVFGVAIPVIVRHGTSPAVVSLGSVTVAYDTAMKMQVASGALYRSGSQSVYGTFVAKFISNHGGEPQVLSVAKGVAVYAQNPLRKFRLPLDIPKGTKLSNGKLVVDFQTYIADATNQSVLASTQLALK